MEAQACRKGERRDTDKEEMRKGVGDRGRNKEREDKQTEAQTKTESPIRIFHKQREQRSSIGIKQSYVLLSPSLAW